MGSKQRAHSVASFNEAVHHEPFVDSTGTRGRDIVAQTSHFPSRLEGAVTWVALSVELGGKSALPRHVIPRPRPSHQRMSYIFAMKGFLWALSPTTVLGYNFTF